MTSLTIDPAECRLLKRWINLILISLVVLVLGAPYVRAKAADYTQIGSDDFTYTFYVDAAIDYDIQSYDDAIDIVVPLYVNISSSANIPRFSYLNGIGGLVPSILQQLPCTVNGSAPNFNYFEPVNNNLIIGRIDQNSYIIFNDFYLNYDQSSYYNQILLGYIHYSHSVGGSPVMVRYSTSSYTYTTTTAYSVWYSDYQHGAAEAIIDAINNASDINSIITLLQSIQTNTALLSQVVSGISSTNSYLADILQILASVDNDIDTVSWISGSTSGITYHDSSMTQKTSNFTDTTVYVQLHQRLNTDRIYEIILPVGRNAPYNLTSIQFGRFSSGDFLDNGNYILSSRCYRYYTIIYIQVYSDSNLTGYTNTGFKFNFSTSGTNYINASGGQISLKYLPTSDIEYWTILNTIYSQNLYDLLYLYIYGESTGADTGNEAADTLGSEAAAEHAVHESLYALSPGNISDLDSADGLAVLNDIANSTQFWGTLVTEFANVSTVIWGFFILALLLGLIAFILRL